MSSEEKKTWIRDCRKLLQEQDKTGTRKEIAEVLGLSVQWVSKYDDEPIQPNKEHKVLQRGTFPDSNVWGLEDGKVAKGDPQQPDSERQGHSFAV